MIIYGTVKLNNDSHNLVGEKMGSSVSKVIERWKSLPSQCSEADLERNLMTLIWDAIGLKYEQIKNRNIRNVPRLKPDY